MSSLASIRERIEWLTFDCYGTLIDWERGIGDCLTSLASRTACSRAELIDAYVRTEAEIEQREYHSYRDVQALTLDAMARSCGFEVADTERDALTRSLPDWPPFPDTNAALARLGRRFQLGILSNIDNDLLAKTCRHFEVQFDLLITAEDVRSYKPAHGHFNRMLDETDCGREGVLHVAQSLYHDAAPASELGLQYVWINRYGQKTPRDVPMLAEFKTLGELANALGV